MGMKKKKVMVVDDEEDFLKITKINLEQTGRYEVTAVSDASAIVSQVKSFRPDIILLDILMPKTGGVEACKMLKEDTEARHIPVVVVSALDTENDKRAMKELGAVDFIVKPIEKGDLIARIEKVLQGQG